MSRRAPGPVKTACGVPRTGHAGSWPALAIPTRPSNSPTPNDTSRSPTSGV